MHFLSSSYENHLAPFSCGAPPLSFPLEAQEAGCEEIKNTESAELENMHCE